MIRETAADSVAGEVASLESALVLRNVVSLGSGEVLARVVAFVGTAYLARTLGADGFGVIGFAAALVGYLALAVTAGFDDCGAREVARRPEDARTIAASVLLVRLALALLAAVALALIVPFLPQPPGVRLVVLLAGLTFFSLAIDTAWVYKGLERSRRVGAALALGQTLSVGLLLLFVHGPDDTWRVPPAQFAGELSAGLYLAVPLLGGGGFRVGLADGIKVLWASGPLAFQRVLRTLIFTADVVLIGLLLGDRQAGLYTASYRVCFLLLVLAIAIHFSYLPAMTRAAVRGPAEVAATFRRSLQLASTVAAPVVVGGAVVAAPLLTLLFGASFADGMTALRLLLLSIGLIFLSSGVHNVLLIYNRLRVETAIVALAAILNVGLNVVLIPRYGLAAAASVTVLSEGVIFLCCLRVAGTLGIGVDARVIVRLIARPVLAALVMAAVLLALPSTSVLLAVPLGGVVYLAMLAVLRAVPEDARPLVDWGVARVRSLMPL